jgi:hypothetical protein
VDGTHVNFLKLIFTDCWWWPEVQWEGCHLVPHVPHFSTVPNFPHPYLRGQPPLTCSLQKQLFQAPHRQVTRSRQADPWVLTPRRTSTLCAGLSLQGGGFFVPVHFSNLPSSLWSISGLPPPPTLGATCPQRWSLRSWNLEFAPQGDCVPGQHYLCDGMMGHTGLYCSSSS